MAQKPFNSNGLAPKYSLSCFLVYPPMIPSLSPHDPPLGDRA